MFWKPLWWNNLHFMFFCLSLWKVCWRFPDPIHWKDLSGVSTWPSAYTQYFSLYANTKCLWLEPITMRREGACVTEFRGDKGLGEWVGSDTYGSFFHRSCRSSRGVRHTASHPGHTSHRRTWNSPECCTLWWSCCPAAVGSLIDDQARGRQRRGEKKYSWNLIAALDI